MGLSLSPNQADWGTFGDFIGGTLNPIYAFLAFIGAIYAVITQAESVAAQNDQLQLMKTQKKLDEFQTIISGVAAAIDSALFEKRLPSLAGGTETFSLFHIIRELSDMSLTIELNPEHPDSMIYSDFRSSLLYRAGHDISFIQEQLVQLLYCLDFYKSNEGCDEIVSFYKIKYSHTVFWMEQISYLNVPDLAKDFDTKLTKESVIKSLKG
jgi:hypothetical protein